MGGTGTIDSPRDSGSGDGDVKTGGGGKAPPKGETGANVDSPVKGGSGDGGVKG